MTKSCQLLIVSIVLAVPALARAQDALQAYAQKCDVAIGVTVPDFNCDARTAAEVPTTNAVQSACDRPNQLHQECDPGSRYQTLVDIPDRAYIVAHCRKQASAAGKYGDIAVIQHNRVNGATCFYQALKNNVGHELDGDAKAPSKGVGTPKFWMEPSEIASSSFTGACAKCHDNGPIIRSPYLTQPLRSTPPHVLPGAGDDNFNSDLDPYYFVGSEFAHWKAYKVEIDDKVPDNLTVKEGEPYLTCIGCHRLGVNNLSSRNGTARDFAIRATARSQTNKNPHSAQSPLWMLKGQTVYIEKNDKAAEAIKRCADTFAVGTALPNLPDCKITQFSGPAPGPTLRLGGQLKSDPAVALTADGRLEIFAIGLDNALYHIWQIDPTGGWSSWGPLAGEVKGNPAVGCNADTGLEVFVRAPDNSLRHIWQTSSNGGWSDWRSMGGVLATDPTVVSLTDGRLVVFARGTDNALWHSWQTSPNGEWSDWHLLGGILPSGFAVGRNADGGLEVFAQGTDNAVWRRRHNSSQWSGWVSMGGQVTGDPVVESNADGRLVVFVRGLNNALWHSWQTSPNGEWSDWHSFGRNTAQRFCSGPQR